MNVADQERALLQLIADDCRSRCAEVMDAAGDQAAELLRLAHRQARDRVHAALRDARERAAQRVAAAAAQRQTRIRLSQQHAAGVFLAQAHARLPSALIARWQQTTARRIWVRYALQQAVLGLPPGRWRIDHAPGLSAADIAELAAPTAAALEWRLDPTLEAGLRVVGDGNCLDASLNGLLADRDALSARLLSAWGKS